MIVPTAGAEPRPRAGAPGPGRRRGRAARRARSRRACSARALASLGDRYPYVILDCPPSLGLLTINALAAADRLIVPVQCEYYALEGLSQLLESVERVRASAQPAPVV